MERRAPDFSFVVTYHPSHRGDDLAPGFYASVNFANEGEADRIVDKMRLKDGVLEAVVDELDARMGLSGRATQAACDAAKDERLVRNRRIDNLRCTLVKVQDELAILEGI